MKIELFTNSVEAGEIAATAQAVSGKWLLNGPEVVGFEKEFAEHFGFKHAIAMNSGTAGLHSALAVIGMKSGDEVVLPAFNFIAAGCAVMQAGGKPVFCDVAEDGNMDPASLVRMMSERTKAVLVLHYAGRPADLTEIRTIAEKYKAVVIEDAAHALGAKHDDDPIGRSDGAVVFSFGPAKHLVTCMGGMVVTEDSRVADKLRQFRSYGMDRSMFSREGKEKAWSYGVPNLGHNFRMPDPLAAMGRVQIRKIDEIIRVRREIARAYDGCLTPYVEHIHPVPTVCERGLDSPLYYVVRLVNPAKRDAFVEGLNAMGVSATVHWDKLLPEFAVFGSQSTDDYPISLALSRSVATLPLHQNLTTDERDFVVQAVGAVLADLA
tara:strand:- start:36398 stop:37534 length:1137 start_codon:yes stop_codon:yes gene_type:complete